MKALVLADKVQEASSSQRHCLGHLSKWQQCSAALRQHEGAPRFDGPFGFRDRVYIGL